MKKLFPIFCLLSSSFFAQQLPQFTQAVLQKNLYNPAFTGENPEMQIGLTGRWQMIGFGNEPQTALLTFEKGIRIKEKTIYNPSLHISQEIPEDHNREKRKFSHGFGGQLGIDNYGAFKNLQLAGVYGAHYQFTPLLKLSAGIRMSFNNNSFDPAKAVVLNPSNPSQVYSGGDSEYDAFTAGRRSMNFLHFGAGINLTFQNFFIGVAANQLTKDAVKFGSSGANFSPQTHLFLMTGYKFEINSEFSFQTIAVLKKMQPAPLSMEFCLLGNFGESLFAGVNYHHNASAGLIVGFNVNEHFRVGYALDVPTTKLNRFSFGGHELMLTYRF